MTHLRLKQVRGCWGSPGQEQEGSGSFLDCLLLLEVFPSNLNQLRMGRASKQAHPFERLVQLMLPFPSSAMIYSERSVMFEYFRISISSWLWLLGTLDCDSEADARAECYERAWYDVVGSINRPAWLLEQYEQSKEAGLKLVRREGLVRSIEGSNQRTCREFPQALLAST